MELKWWWILLLGVLIGAAVLFFLVRYGNPAATLKTVAHAERLTALPRYQDRLRSYKRWLAVALVAAFVAAAALLVAASKPQSTATFEPELSNRDIMLCLDVSGSMVSTDQRLVKSFADLAKNFKGERIGLTIFDASAVMVFPLTDDYNFIVQQLKVAEKSLDPYNPDFDFFNGTYEGYGASLIGDGVASCVTAFPNKTADGRSRSMILATDNQLAGKPLFTLAEAAALAKKQDVRIYALDPVPGRTFRGGTPSDGLKAATATSNGAYYPLSGSADSFGGLDQSTVSDVVKQVQSTEAKIIKAPPRILVMDHPEVFLLIALFSAMVLVFALWRLRL